MRVENMRKLMGVILSLLIVLNFPTMALADELDDAKNQLPKMLISPLMKIRRS